MTVQCPLQELQEYLVRNVAQENFSLLTASTAWYFVQKISLVTDH